MTTQDRDAILQAAAKTLVCDLYRAAGYGRTREPISVEEFDRELRVAARRWRVTHRNLKQGKEQQP